VKARIAVVQLATSAGVRTAVIGGLLQLSTRRVREALGFESRELIRQAIVCSSHASWNEHVE